MQDLGMTEARIALVADVVSAYVSNNRVEATTLPELISSVSRQFGVLGAPVEEETPQHTPAVNPRKSVSDEFITSLIDGRKYKALKRHLTQHGLTPAEYRARYNLPADYPMVAPAYSLQRSAMAKRLGLGRLNRPDGGVVMDKTGATKTATEAAPAPSPAEQPKADAAPKSDAGQGDKAAAKTPKTTARKPKGATDKTLPVDGLVSKEAKAKSPRKAKAEDPAPAPKGGRGRRAPAPSVQAAA